MNAGTQVSAQFDLAPPPVTLTVARNGTGSGTVTSADGKINCGLTCVAAYGQGSLVTLTAKAAPGSAFTKWSGCDVVSGSTCTVTMGASKSVTATFNKRSKK